MTQVDPHDDSIDYELAFSAMLELLMPFWMKQESMPADAALGILIAEHDRYREALIECAKLSGADVSDGVPSWPSVDVWAVQEVKQLREDSDEDSGPSLSPEQAEALLKEIAGTEPSYWTDERLEVLRSARSELERLAGRR